MDDAMRRMGVCVGEKVGQPKGEKQIGRNIRRETCQQIAEDNANQIGTNPIPGLNVDDQMVLKFI
jgi:hypothetical protein